MLNRGDVVITCPEFRLSAYLKALESQRSGSQAQWACIKWCDANVRHLLDESDEILRVNYQLVYAIGAQRQLDAAPNRWASVGILLEGLKGHLQALCAEFPASVELVYDAEAKEHEFPRQLRLLDNAPYVQLLELLVDDVILQRCSMPSLQQLTDELQEQVRRAARDNDAVSRDQFSDDSKLRKAALMLRGLLKYEVLFFCLTRRYRVDYGVSELHKSRLAVPYRAKDVPAERAEFGHPDVASCLTFLSYYYSGLQPKDMIMLLYHLKALPSGEAEYSMWWEFDSIRREHIALRDLNLLDMGLLHSKVFPHVKFNQRAINYFLNNFIFTKEAKQFPQRLAASAWELTGDHRASSSPNSTGKVCGFSGTNGTAVLLPLTVEQNDLTELEETNDSVNRVLVDTVNNFYAKLKANAGAADIVSFLVRDFARSHSGNQYKLQVLLDVGALVLDASNRAFVETWLSQCDRTEIEGAVYFDESNRIVVLDHGGIVTPYSLSPLRYRLGACIIYIDHMHTRGTDLPIPQDIRACVTLGKGLTRDRFAQGCMRMRFLEDKGHALLLLASNDVHDELTKLNNNTTVNAQMVLNWCLRNTKEFIKNHLVQWACYGIEYFRKVAQLENSATNEPLDLSVPEVLLLEDLYGPSRCEQPLHEIVRTRIRALHPHVNGMETGIGQVMVGRVLSNAGGDKGFGHMLDEEQERELEMEMEEELERELPKALNPEEPRIHPDVCALAKCGSLNTTRGAFVPIYKAYEQTSVGGYMQNKVAWEDPLMVSAEYSRTVLLKQGCDVLDEYMRAVQWLAYVPTEGKAIIITSYEVNALWPEFKQNHRICLAMFAPKLRRKQDMLFQDPAFRITPNKLQPIFKLCENIVLQHQHQLRLFSASLYWDDAVSLKSYCQFLGLCPRPRTEAQEAMFDGVRIERSGFVPRQFRIVVDPGAPIMNSWFSACPTATALAIVRMQDVVQYLPTSHADQLYNFSSKATIGEAIE